MKMPTVDIIIAAKNEAASLGACLDALRGQDYPPDRQRIYVVDNGSTDATAHIAQQGGALLVHAPQGGAAAARNAALRQGGGELVAFLDAHCIPSPNWVRRMSDYLQDPAMGGCQSRIDNRSTNPRVQRYLEQTGLLANERILDDTVRGARNIYPWLLSGSCMYRRAALVAAGLFDETLVACEDVELSWRVLLLGYRLGYVPDAGVIHYDGNSWYGFVRKGLRYGRGAATLAHAYGQHGAHNTFRPRRLRSTHPELVISSLYYWLGYRLQDARLRLGMERAPLPVPPAQPLVRFRRRFAWTAHEALQIAPTTVFWLRDDKAVSVVVNIPAKTRVVLEGTADVIWRKIVKEADKAETIRALVDGYNISPTTAAADLDDFMEELAGAGLLIRDLS